MAPRAQGEAHRRGEDWIVFVVLMATLFFLVFMMSIPIWFNSFVRGLTG